MKRHERKPRMYQWRLLSVGFFKTVVFEVEHTGSERHIVKTKKPKFYLLNIANEVWLYGASLDSVSNNGLILF